MNLLAIDGSTKCTGIAIYEDDKLIFVDVIKSSSQNLLKRIRIMQKGVEELIEKYNIDTVVIEEVLPKYNKGGEDDNQVCKNNKTLKALLYLQHGFMLVLEKFNLANYDFMYPSEWRKLCGIKNGRGVKRDIGKKLDIRFVADTFNIKDINDDAADAVGLGYGYLISRGIVPVPAQDIELNKNTTSSFFV